VTSCLDCCRSLLRIGRRDNWQESVPANALKKAFRSRQWSITMKISSGAWDMITSTPDGDDIMDVLQLGPALDVRGGVSSVEKLIAGHPAAHVRVTHVATMEDGSFWRKLKVFSRSVLVLRRAVKLNDKLVVHIHFSSRGSTLRKLILVWITLHADRPLVLHAHGSVFDSFFDRLPTFARAIVRRTFARADCFIVLSSQWKRFYVDRFGLRESQVVVLCNPAALPSSTPDRTARSRVQFLFLGRIGERKGSFDLLQAFARLPEAVRKQARLVFAGDGEVDALRAAASELGESVVVHSWIDSKQRDRLLVESDVFALPSYNEGVPMAMLEAMAYGMPIVATPVGGIPDAVTHEVEALLVEPGAVEQLSAALHRLIEQDTLRHTLGRNARARAERCDIKQYSLELARIYRRLVSASRAPHTPANDGLRITD
jgi:glycosyltransferase involved in cell wall biosynthesis